MTNLSLQLLFILTARENVPFLVVDKIIKSDKLIDYKTRGKLRDCLPIGWS